MRYTKLMEGMHNCYTCGAVMYVSAGNYCSRRCEVIGECGE